MKVYYLCESCREVFFEGQLGQEEGVLTVNALCPECAEELGLNQDVVFTNHYYS